jgi:glutathionylspermidine synthase
LSSFGDSDVDSNQSIAIPEQPISMADTEPLRPGDELPDDLFQAVRQRLVLDAYKWDPQVGDVSTISRFPLLLGKTHWAELSRLATLLAAELITAEQELLERPDLHSRLGLPGGIRSVLRQAGKFGATRSAARVLRFDFHWTRDGWRISEVNSDVPGGFSEASELPALMARYNPRTQQAGNPGAAWADAIAASVPKGHPALLVVAAGFLEDQQVVAYLAHLLRRRRITSHWATPGDLRWKLGHAYLQSRSILGPIGAIVRFFQAEWLDAHSCAPLFVGGQTPVCNTGIAILSESKRFPLVWDQLSTALPTWRRLLPTTADPRHADWLRNDGWVVKSAFCNTGDTVMIRSLLSNDEWRSGSRAVLRHPAEWVAQRRFAACPIQTPCGPIYPCIGVYTVNGCPKGIYGRFSYTPVIDFAAVDVAILIADD